MYAHIVAIMPTHICTRRCDHAHACVRTNAGSCPRVYARIGAVMPTCVHTYKRVHAHAFLGNQRCHAHACMHTNWQSRPRTYAQKGAVMPRRVCAICPNMYALLAIMPTLICIHKRDHARTYMHTKAESCPRLYANISPVMPPCVMHTKARSCLRVDAHICAIMPTCIRTHRRDHAQ
jgi:hypothetical protein